MTMTHGSGVCFTRNPSRKGLVASTMFRGGIEILLLESSIFRVLRTAASPLVASMPQRLHYGSVRRIRSFYDGDSVVLTSCPPHSLRKAAITCAVKDAACR